MNLGFVAAAFLDGTKPISYAAAREAAYDSCEHRDDGENAQHTRWRTAKPFHSDVRSLLLFFSTNFANAL
jgi:hypothetical protein